MADWLEQIQAETAKLIPPRSAILIAVSGGVDSMVLATALQRAAKANRWRLVIGHFNHRLRGRASTADAQLVKRFCVKNHLPFHSAKWEQDPAAIKEHGLEMAAREARYDFLKSIARKTRCRFIITAHHADDQAETFLWRLMRGAGGKGLGGIQPLSNLDTKSNLKLARPLLHFSKADLLSAAKSAGILFREDASNSDPKHLRNKIRTQLLPYLKRHFHPEIEYPIHQSQTLVTGDADFAAQYALDWLKDSSGTPFDKLHIAIQRWVLWHQLIKQGITPQFFMVEELRAHVDHPFSIGPNQQLQRDAHGRLHCLSPDDLSHSQNESVISPKASWSQQTQGSTRIEYRLATRLPQTFSGEVFDADMIGSMPTIRHWREGDRFQPIGRTSASKLKTLFINAKISNSDKRSAALGVTMGGDIFWVEGLRIGELAKVRHNTQRFLLWKWSKI